MSDNKEMRENYLLKIKGWLEKGELFLKRVLERYFENLKTSTKTRIVAIGVCLLFLVFLCFKMFATAPENSFLEILEKLVSITSGGVILLLTGYSFYLRFYSRRIKIFGFGTKQGIFQGYRLSFVLENLSLSPIFIKKIELVIDNKYIVPFVEGSPFIELKSLHAENLTSTEVSSYHMEGKRINLSSMIMPWGDSLFMIVLTSRNQRLFVKYEGKIEKKDYSSYRRINTLTQTFNDIVYLPETKFAITYKIEEKEIGTILVDKGGRMSSDLFGINFLPKEALKTKKALERFLKYISEKYDISLFVDELDNS